MRPHRSVFLELVQPSPMNGLKSREREDLIFFLKEKNKRFEDYFYYFENKDFYLLFCGNKGKRKRKTKQKSERKLFIFICL